jgi:hypothetical protein
MQDVRDDIDEAISTGFVVVLLSPEAVAREESFQWFEVNYALERMLYFVPGRPRVIPVVLRGFAETLSLLPLDLQRLHALDISTLSREQQPSHIMRALDQFVAEADA